MISFVRNLVRGTSWHRAYWARRKLDWDASYLQTWTHPHRALIIEVLKAVPWFSLIEIGVGGGANLMRIMKEMPGRQLGGMDINADAIALAEKTFRGGVFKVNDACDIMMSDKSADVVLSDATYIYVSPRHIKKYIREAKRVARKYLVLCELHSFSWWNRLALFLNSGYYCYNWKRLLEKEGFYDVSLCKIPPQDWLGPPWELFGYVILAKVPS